MNPSPGDFAQNIPVWLAPYSTAIPLAQGSAETAACSLRMWSGFMLEPAERVAYSLTALSASMSESIEL
jgi:hypothetical protein